MKWHDIYIEDPLGLGGWVVKRREHMLSHYASVQGVQVDEEGTLAVPPQTLSHHQAAEQSDDNNIDCSSIMSSSDFTTSEE